LSARNPRNLAGHDWLVSDLSVILIYAVVARII
jgi:hypothetical protein